MKQSPSKISSLVGSGRLPRSRGRRDSRKSALKKRREGAFEKKRERKEKLRWLRKKLSAKQYKRKREESEKQPERLN